MSRSLPGVYLVLWELNPGGFQGVMFSFDGCDCAHTAGRAICELRLTGINVELPLGTYLFRYASHDEALIEITKSIRGPDHGGL